MLGLGACLWRCLTAVHRKGKILLITSVINHNLSWASVSMAKVSIDSSAHWPDSDFGAQWPCCRGQLLQKGDPAFLWPAKSGGVIPWILEHLEQCVNHFAQGCHSKVMQIGRLKQPRFILSQFWRLDVWDRDASGVGFFCGLWPGL